jgi:dUTP pyrophosphatase
MVKRILQKIVNYAYGFDVNDANPFRLVDLFYYTDYPSYEPEYMSDGAVGFDVIAYLGDRHSITILPGESIKINTGLYVEIPPFYEGRLVARSGLSDRELIFVNGIGEIDWDYRGQMRMPLKNISNEPLVITNGQRLSQLVICRVARCKFMRLQSKDLLSITKRGDKGFSEYSGK